MSNKKFYLLQKRLVFENKFHHVAFGENIEELINNCITFDQSIDSYIITELGTDKIVYRCFQENVTARIKNLKKVTI